MKYANTVNNLVVKFKRMDFNEAIEAEMLVMERIRPIDYRAYEIEIRELWIDVFEDESVLYIKQVLFTETSNDLQTSAVWLSIIFY